MIAFSFANLAALGVATIAASTTFVDASHPASSVQLPTRPFLRAYSPNVSSAHRLTLDLGSSVSLQVVAPINANFLAATVQGNATDAWGGALGYTQAVTMARAPNDRIHHAHRPVTLAQRYVSLSIPVQATTDGQTRFALGGLWAGLLTLPPREILIDFDEGKPEARKDNETEDGRPMERIIYDEPAYMITCTRLAKDDSEVTAWREIDRRWSAAPGQAALVLLRAHVPAEAFVMKQMGVSKWSTVQGNWRRSEMVLREATAG